MPSQAQLSAPSHDVVWAVIGGLYLFRSTDEGALWTQRALPRAPGTPFVSFLDSNQGWALLSAGVTPGCTTQSITLWHTMDGGGHWDRLVATGVEEDRCKDRLVFVNANVGFLAAWNEADPPVIYQTTDGGVTWHADSFELPPGWVAETGGAALRIGELQGFAGSFLAIASGTDDQGFQRSFAFQSTDAGATWKYSSPVVGDETFVTADRWLRIQTGQESTDGGRSWHPFSDDYSDAAGVASQFVFADAMVGYGTVRGDVHRTVDGGAHWSLVKSSWP